jgi:hypothetical protein
MLHAVNTRSTNAAYTSAWFGRSDFFVVGFGVGFDAGFLDIGLEEVVFFVVDFDVGFLEAGFLDVGFLDMGFLDVGFLDMGFLDVGLEEVGFVVLGFAWVLMLASWSLIWRM